MSKRPASAAKRLTQANLEALGAERLAALLLELGDSQPALKRRLRMELAAEVGAGDLALEVDKRIDALAASKARVSWRKRGELIVDLHVLRVMIARRLGDLDPAIALPRLVTFVSLADPLGARVRDPRGELDAVFAAAAQDLTVLTATAPAPGAALVDQVAALLLRGSSDMAARLAGALRPLGAAFGQALLATLTAQPRLRPGPVVLRLVADAAGDVDAFIETVPAALRRDPATGAAIAERLLSAGRVEAALAALKASSPDEHGRPFGALRPAEGPHVEAWCAIYIEALERSGNAEGAQAERWAAFERTLSPLHLRAYLKRLADFDDVIAADRAFALAAAGPFTRGLAFLMDWPALAEAAAMVEARRMEIAAEPSDLIEWSARLEGRYPAAALLLLRAAIAHGWRDRAVRDEIERWVDDAAALANRVGAGRSLEPHESFMARLTAGRSGAH